MSRASHLLDISLQYGKSLLLRATAVICINCFILSTTASIIPTSSERHRPTSTNASVELGTYPSASPSVDAFVLSDFLKRDALGLTAHGLDNGNTGQQPPRTLAEKSLLHVASPGISRSAPSTTSLRPLAQLASTPPSANPSEDLLAAAANSGPSLFAPSESGYEPPPATLVITPATGAFGSVPVGTKSPGITFTAQNNTSAAVTYTGSSGLTEFTVLPGNCNIANNQVMLAAGATCTFTATFSPTTPGPVSGSLSIATNAGSVSLPISGTGAGLLITPSSATFGNVPVGTSSPVVTFTAYNYTSAPAYYASSSGLSEFNVTPGTCHLVNGDPMLAAGATCTFTASFSPTTAGPATGSLNISTSSGPIVVSLTGIGGSAQGLVITPSTGAFGSVPVGTTSPTLTFTATDNASTPVFYSGYSGSPEFSVLPGNCHIVNGDPMLAPGQSCAFTATFKPTAAGPVNGSVNINTSSGIFAFPLTGTGGSAAAPVANPGGPYTGSTSHPVTFQGSASTAPAGQTITAYAWNFGDGTSGTGVSPTHTYSAAGTYNIVLTVTDTDNVTSVASTTARITAGPTPLSIRAVVSPAPNAAGWNNSPVTVTFACTTTGPTITSCATTQTVSTEGANQVISGTVTDANGDLATASVTVNLATTPPVIAVLSPGNNSTITLSTASIGVSGTATSNVASIVSVTCGGLPATLSGTNFTCTAALGTGANSIPVVAKDIAGNVSTYSLKLTYVAAPALRILAPANLGISNLTPVTLNGTVSDPTATVTVDGVTVPQSGGGFSVPVPLVEGLNILTAVATNAAGISTTATVEVTLDTTPPHVLINSPPNGTVLTSPSVTVTGLANDVVVGTVNLSDLKVAVNGIAAQVANRSFSALNVPLALGPNTIQAVGTDKAGNSTTTSVIVTRVLASQPPAPTIGKALLTNWVNIVSGNNQTGTVGTALGAPVVVSLTDSASHPVPNQMVVFKVTANNGLVTSAGGTPSSALAVTTDSNGQAQVTWTLGQRAGAGNNTLSVSSALAVSPVTITANGSQGKPVQVVVDSGNNQTGILGQPLPFPFVVDVIDAGHNRVPGIPVVFSIKRGGSFAGAPNLTVTSDSNGRAIAILTSGLQEGINNELVEATFAGNSAMPAAFAATAKAPGNPSGTTISGVVLDNSNNPIQSVSIRLYKTNQGSGNNLPVQIGTAVETDAKGTFTIAPAPVGAFKLMADGSTAAGTLTFPTLEYDIVTVAGNDNTVGMPIYLPSLDTVNKVCVDETHGGVLTLPQYPGFALNIPAGSATFPGGARSGCVSATPVNGDKVPMSPGFGQQPRFIVTIQPVGTIFSPPAAMTLPNVDGLAPKSVIEMYSYDHDLAMFVAVGTATVSPDGSVITSDPGVGVVKAGWHCGGDPNTIGSAGTCPQCNVCTGDQCGPGPSGVACTATDACTANATCDGAGGCTVGDKKQLTSVSVAATDGDNAVTPVNPLLKVAGDNESTYPVLFQATAQSQNCTDLNYDWDYGDGSPVDMNAGDHPTHGYTESGIYSVNVTAHCGACKSAQVMATMTVVIVQAIDVKITVHSSANVHGGAASPDEVFDTSGMNPVGVNKLDHNQTNHLLPVGVNPLDLECLTDPATSDPTFGPQIQSLIQWDIQNSGNGNSPTLKPNGKLAKLSADQKGLWPVSCYLDANHNQKLDDSDADSNSFNVDFVATTVTQPRSKSNPALIKQTTVKCVDSICVSSGGDNPVDLDNAGFWAMMSISADDAGANLVTAIPNSNFEYTYAQNFTQDTFSANYPGGRSIKEVFVNPPSSYPDQLICKGSISLQPTPVLDDGAYNPSGFATGGTTVTNTGQQRETATSAMNRMITFADNPAVGEPILDPCVTSDPPTMASMTGFNQFSLYLLSFSAEFPSAYAALAQVNPQVSYTGNIHSGIWSSQGATSSILSTVTGSPYPMDAGALGIDVYGPSDVASDFKLSNLRDDGTH